MNPTELRIGNLVHHIGLGTSAVLEIRSTGITVANPKDYSNAYYEPNESLHRIEPLDLTPEWLERLGAKRTLNSPHGDWILGRWWISWDEDDQVFWMELGYYVLDLPYVHTLQNIMLDLKQELKTKE